MDDIGSWKLETGCWKLEVKFKKHYFPSAPLGIRDLEFGIWILDFPTIVFDRLRLTRLFNKIRNQ